MSLIDSSSTSISSLIRTTSVDNKASIGKSIDIKDPIKEQKIPFISDAKEIITKTASKVVDVVNFVSEKINKDSQISSANTTKLKDVPQKDVIGAYFNKIEVNENMNNIGITGNAKLPIVNFDPSRYDPKHGYLDIPSVYMGGNSKINKDVSKELDVGLSWDKVYDNNRNLTYTDSPTGTDGGDPTKRYMKSKDKAGNVFYQDYSNPPKIVAGGNSGVNVSDFEKKIKMNYAFRPFWRTTNSEDYQLSIGDKNKTEFNKEANYITIDKKDFRVKNDKNGLYYETKENGNIIRNPLTMQKIKDSNNKEISVFYNKDNKKVDSKADSNILTIDNKDFKLKSDTKGFYYETLENNKTVRHPLVKEKDQNGNDVYFRAADKWHNPKIDTDPNTPANVYFYPGQDINMTVKTGKNGNATLIINSSDGKTKFSQNFMADGFGKDKLQSFKAVNSIDQFTVINGERKGLEGLKSGVLPTKTTVNDATWNLSVIQKDKNKEVVKPVDSTNSHEFRGSDTLPEDFSRTQTKENGKIVKEIDIDPNEVAHQKIESLKAKTINEVKYNLNEFKNKLSSTLKPAERDNKIKAFLNSQINLQHSLLLKELTNSKINISDYEKTRLKSQIAKPFGIEIKNK